MIGAACRGSGARPHVDPLVISSSEEGKGCLRPPGL